MHQLLLQSLFYLFAGLALISAFMVITQNNPVRCVLFLVLTFFASAVLWILLQAEFLALILVLVYVGAVMTLFLFVVMMLNIDVESMRKHFAKHLPLGLILVALLVALLLFALPKETTLVEIKEQSTVPVAVVADATLIDANAAPMKQLSNTEQIGAVLYTDYVFAFEIAAVLLLVAIVSAISLVHRETRAKRQNVIQQIMTRREDRIELIAMKSEK